MGREREYADNADRQRAYRQRKAEQERRMAEELRRARMGGATRPRSTPRPTLPEAKRRTLAKMLGMLGSADKEERDTAGLMAVDFVKKTGLTWFDILDVEEK